jgi:exonuclease SbcC
VIRKIILENYMSHARTAIEPAAGLTILVGPNNCGKSAVVSALETLARTTRGDFMVRHGAKEAKVTIETDDGHTIVWRRKGSTVSYVIDGREVHRGVPDDLHEHLKLPLVESDRGGDPFDVHFAQQKSPIFLINESGGRAATFFSASSDAGRLLEIQDRHRDKVREQRRRKADRVAEVARLEEELSRLAGLPELSAGVAALEAEHAALTERDAAIAALERMTGDLAAAERAVVIRGERAAVLRPLLPPPELAPTDPLEQLLERAAAESVALARAAAAGEATAELRPPPEQVDIAPLVELGRNLRRAERDAGYRRALRAALAPLAAPPELADTAAAEALLATLRAMTRQTARLAAEQACLSTLRDAPELLDPRPLAAQIDALAKATVAAAVPALSAGALAALREPPELSDLSVMESAIAALVAAQNDAATRRRQANVLAARLEAVADEIREWAQENPTCPICGGSIVAEALLNDDGGHAHG